MREKSLWFTGECVVEVIVERKKEVRRENEFSSLNMSNCDDVQLCDVDRKLCVDVF